MAEKKCGLQRKKADVSRSQGVCHVIDIFWFSVGTILLC